MAKIFVGLLCIFSLYGCVHSGVPETGLGSDVPVAVDTTFADTAKVPAVGKIVEEEITVKKDTVIVDTIAVIKKPTLQEIYTSYIGVRELTGNNDGKEVERFLKNVGLGKGYPWCAAFVKTCLLEAGIKEASRINGMALSCENKSNFVYNKNTLLQPPISGDVFTLWYASLGRIGHTGFLHKKINSTIYETVEGNTSGGTVGVREGDGVYKRKRSFKATHSISRWTKDKGN